MAIYHFSAQVISRSQGRSSVAASAYRSGEKLVDERTGQTHDFTRKQDVVQKDILLPEKAPAKFSDRATLWNAVEKAERRKDAQVAREINIALPRELSLEQNWEMAKAFVQREFVDQGMIADLAFHKGHPGQEEQPHVHVMLTMREVGPEGFGQKVRAWNAKNLLQDWRERWAEHCNISLARAGHDLRIDHRTLEAQGINLEPQSKIGPKSSEHHMARFAEHQALAERNGARLLAEPEIALKALTQQQSTFSDRDIARFVHRHTVDVKQFQHVLTKLKAHPDLVCVGRNDRGQERFSTRELVSLEERMLQQAVGWAGASVHAVQAHAKALQQGITLSASQQGALQHVTAGGDVTCLVGLPGSGKSTLLGAAREAWESKGYSVKGMALAGIAAENLEKGSEIPSRTIASHLWHWDRGRESLHAKDIVIMDEAGMVGSRQMAQVVEEVTRAKAKLVLVGDSEQLQAIAAGAAFRAIAERVGFCELNEIHRQHADWQKQATRNFATTRTAEGLKAYADHGNVHNFATQSQAIDALLERWHEVRSQSPASSQIVLAYTRAEVAELNTGARALRRAHGELGPDHVVETDRGTRTLASGDRLYFLRNDRDLAVKNGTLGTLESIEGERLSVRLDGEKAGSGRSVDFNLKDYNAIDHGYAATVYKGQGVTVDRTYVLASPYFDRHTSNVAMSRHRTSADLYVTRDTFLDFGALTRTLGRERTKDMTVDYGLERAEGLASGSRGSLREEIEAAVGQEQGAGLSLLEHERTDASAAARGSLSDFTVQFEKEHPESARTLSDAIFGEAALSPPEHSAPPVANRRCLEELPKAEITADIADVAKRLQSARDQPVGFTLREGDRGHYRGLIGEKGQRFGILQHADSLTLLSEDRLVGQRTGCVMEIQAEKGSEGRVRLVAVNCEREKERTIDREPSERDSLDTKQVHDRGREQEMELEL